jgi:nucleoside-diphosphate-sugar epimerase
LKVVVLGSDGFFGKNLFSDLSLDFECYASTRRAERLKEDKKVFYFDLKEETSWNGLKEIKPDCIINCIVGSVLQTPAKVKETIDINYCITIKFYDFLAVHLPDTYLLHFGTAFEYDLAFEALTEETACVPRTYYGISKYLTSNYLLMSNPVSFSIIRPFNMIGPFDKTDKIIPYLIDAQKKKTPIALSGGMQKRDYLFIKDLSVLIKQLIKNPLLRKHKIINAGSGTAISLKEVAQLLSAHINEFDSSLWQWGKLPYRKEEGLIFFNKSKRATECGMPITPLDNALELTLNYYWNN